MSGFIPKMMHGVPHNEDGVGGAHLYMPWWLDNRTLDFPRGYHIELSGGRRMPGAGFLGGIHRFRGTAGDGQRSPRPVTARRSRTTTGASMARRWNFSGRGKMIPNERSYCEIDPWSSISWGIPVLRFHFKWSDYEYDQVRHMQHTFRALIDEMGGTRSRRCRRASAATASRRAGASSTRSA